jgi:SulP family sulfate permease
LNIIDEITETRVENKEAIAQGSKYFIRCFSGMGGCAMLGQSLINVSNGARARLSGIVAAIALLLLSCLVV